MTPPPRSVLKRNAVRHGSSHSVLGPAGAWREDDSGDGKQASDAQQGGENTTPAQRPAGANASAAPQVRILRQEAQQTLLEVCCACGERITVCCEHPQAAGADAANPSTPTGAAAGAANTAEEAIAAAMAAANASPQPPQTS